MRVLYFRNSDGVAAAAAAVAALEEPSPIVPECTAAGSVGSEARGGNPRGDQLDGDSPALGFVNKTSGQCFSSTTMAQFIR